MRTVSTAIAIVLLVGLAGCNSEEKRAEAQRAALEGESEPSALDGVKADVALTREFDEDAARDAARDSLAGISYEDSEGSGACTDDCGGHKAGWRHAQDGGEDDCDGNSDSYDEGCRAYSQAIDRKVEDAREAFDRGDNAFLKDN